MATVFIHSKSRYCYGACKAHLDVNGHQVVEIPDADAVIIDLD